LNNQLEPVVQRSTQVKLRILKAGICGTDREIASLEY
jgi:threonine dehydrogenase-like Zn-dependent dehydrogenase